MILGFYGSYFLVNIYISMERSRKFSYWEHALSTGCFFSSSLTGKLPEGKIDDFADLNIMKQWKIEDDFPR